MLVEGRWGVVVGICLYWILVYRAHYCRGVALGVGEYLVLAVLSQHSGEATSDGVATGEVYFPWADLCFS
jgi:hypothetical protein